MFKKILVPIDGSEGSNLAIEKSVELLETVSPDQIVFFHVAKTPTQLKTYSGKMGKAYYEMIDNMREYGEEILERAANRLREKGVAAAVETKLIWGDPAYDIVEEAKNENYDLIVIGSRGLDGVKSLLMGSVSNYVTRNAHCIVMVVRQA